MMITPQDFIKDLEVFLAENNGSLDGLTADNVEYDQDDFKMSLFDNQLFTFYFGATRGVLVPQGPADFVMKFDFDGLESNYCAYEAEVYGEAEERGLEKYFAKIKPFCNIGNTWVYIQDYVAYDDGRNCDVDLYDEKNRTTLDKINTKMGKTPGIEELPEEWCLAFVKKYGENELDKLFKFLEEKGINDLHAMNVGYTEDDSPVIFDYSGFFENTDY